MTINITDPAALIAWCIANKRCVVCGEALTKTKKRCCEACSLHWKYCPGCKLPQPWAAWNSSREGSCAACKQQQCKQGRVVGTRKGWTEGQVWRVSRKADRERENVQIDRWRAIEMPWTEIGRRLGIAPDVAYRRHWYWCKAREKASQAQPAGQRGPSEGAEVA